MARSREEIARELLAHRCRRGDRAALEELVRDWEPRLLYFIRRLAGDEADAWDILQKTWLRVLGGIASLDDPQHLAAWLYSIARNTAYSHLRTRPQYESLSEDSAADADAGLEFEDAQQVHRGLLTLSRPHREVLTLFFLNDLSVAEVAAVLGVSPGTVKSRLHYARAALRDAIGDPHE